MLIETLEKRQLMSAAHLDTAGTFRVTGDEAADNLLVRREGAYVVAYDGSQRIGYGEASKTRSVFIDARGGNDRAEIRGGTGTDALGAVPGVIHGGAGDDVLIGGNGPDRMHGGYGNDQLYGQGGNDTLVDIGGGAYDRVFGGAGNDSFWIDANSTEGAQDVSATEQANRAVHRVNYFAGYRYSGSNGQVYWPTKEPSGPNLPDPTGPVHYITGQAMFNGWKNYRNQPLFNGTPLPDDVHQRGVGDCYYLATLSGMARDRAESIRQSVTSLGDGTFAARFYKNGQEQYIRVDADLPTTNGTLAGAQFSPSTGAAWVAILEKAYAIFRSWEPGLYAFQPYAAYGNLNGGYMTESFRALGASSVVGSVAGVGQTVFGGANQLVSWIAGQFQSNKTVVVGTQGSNNAQTLGNNIVAGHAYEIVSYQTHTDGHYWLRLRNPWGYDGNSTATDANAYDGYVWLRADYAASYITSVGAALA